MAFARFSASFPREVTRQNSPCLVYLRIVLGTPAKASTSDMWQQWLHDCCHMRASGTAWWSSSPQCLYIILTKVDCGVKFLRQVENVFVSYQNNPQNTMYMAVIPTMYLSMSFAISGTGHLFCPLSPWWFLPLPSIVLPIPYMDGTNSGPCSLRT